MNTQTQVMARAAKAGGAVLNRYFGASLDTIQKSTAADFRTKADTESEAAILEIFEAELPSYNIISEEMGEKNNDSEYTLVIDPLDGTSNFVLGLPHFTVSIGLMKNDEIIAGVIYASFMDRLFWAEKGKGSFLEDKPLHVGTENEISRSTIALYRGYDNSYAAFQANLIMKLNDLNIKRYLVNWSSAYDFCLLASGKLEAIINNKTDLHDYAAGKLIATEAGAIITGFDDKEIPDKESVFIASNGTDLHQKIVDILR